MSQFLDRLQFFKKKQGEFSDGHGETTNESREWENSYRQRWQYDKIVRSTHGVNCTGSCSWKIYVKNGLVTWETQQTDYPRTRPDLPNHEPRGCPRGASYSWYLYSANRLKYPKVRKPLLKLWREARKTMGPVDAWASIVEDKAKAHLPPYLQYHPLLSDQVVLLIEYLIAYLQMHLFYSNENDIGRNPTKVRL